MTIALLISIVSPSHSYSSRSTRRAVIGEGGTAAEATYPGPVGACPSAGEPLSLSVVKRRPRGVRVERAIEGLNVEGLGVKLGGERARGAGVATGKLERSRSGGKLENPGSLVLGSR